jgi:hypothetical protein
MSDQIESKMVLDEEGQREAQASYDVAVADLLGGERQPANLIGLGVGVKWTGGQPTGEPALLALVTEKIPEDELASVDKVPKKVADMQTDVLAVGFPFAGEDIQDQPGAQTLARRARPARGGYSVGHVKITAGTIATCVYDVLPRTPHSWSGIGIPPRYYILSNNHVLAASNAASLGDPIVQPGSYDGGSDPADRIATLSRFVPITFDPPVPRMFHANTVDAAIAEGDFHDLDRGIYWIGHVRGWRPKSKVTVGTLVQKTGRTTNYTIGRITAVNATVDVNYGGGRVARFRDQIVTTNMSAGGDSGSLVTTLDNVAVGLLFAGSSVATIVNQIANVRSKLRVEVAEEIL